MAAERRGLLLGVFAGVLLTVAPNGVATAHGGAEQPYRWVDGPPGESAAGRTAELVVGTPADLWTPDAQAVLSLPSDALAGPPGTAVAVTLDPASVAGLDPLPEGLAPAGNAYRVDGPVAGPGAIVLAGAHPVTAVLHSPDGRTWERLAHRPAGDGRLEAPIVGVGWYVPATTADHGRPPLGTTVAALLLAGVLAAVGLRRRRTARRGADASGTTGAWTP